MNFVVALIMCTIGFGKYGYFLSVGYGLSMSAMAFSTLLLYAAGRGFALPAYIVIELVIIFLYGIKSCGLNIAKELKTPAPSKEDKLPIAVTVCAWLAFAACLMVLFAPVVFRIKNGAGTYEKSVVSWIGIILSLGGLVLCVLAIYFEELQKKNNPNTFCKTGLYKFVRFPGYTGELLFWTGIFVGSWSGLKTFGQWLLVILAYLAIIYINLNATKRAEKKQYAIFVEGETECKDEFLGYVAKTPIIIPFVKLYTFKDSKIIL